MILNGGLTHGLMLGMRQKKKRGFLIKDSLKSALGQLKIFCRIIGFHKFLKPLKQRRLENQ